MIETAIYDGSDVTTTALEDANTDTGTVWVRATECSDEELVQLVETFGIHPLAIEDVREDIDSPTEEYAVRPKAEVYRDYTFVLLKTATLSRQDTSFQEEIQSERVGFFIGDHWLLTLSSGPAPSIEHLWNTIEDRESWLFERGPDFTAYRLIDSVFDEYFVVLDQLEERIEAVEEQIITDTDLATLDAVNEVRRELLSFRRLVWPSREALSILVRGDSHHVQPATEKYFHDVYDHLVQLVELIETYRELVSGARDMYLNMVSQSTNEVMKTLTIVATIVLPLTLVVGYYGMNFENMPELQWTYSYPAVVIGMFLMALILMVYFQRQDYI